MNRETRRAMKRAERHKPTMRRAVSLDTMTVAKNQAGRITPAERDSVLEQTRQAFHAMRAGRATSDDWACLVWSLSAAYVIEQQGVVKGFGEVIQAADQALTAIEARAVRSGAWAAPTLYAAEIEALDDLLHWHAYQIDQLSLREFNAVRDATDQALRDRHHAANKGRAGQ